MSLNPALMEPLLPSEGKYVLSDLSKEIFIHAGSLNAQLPAEKTRQSVVEVVRIMNSYYSNLIEGHKTFPREIEKALNDKFSLNAEEKNNQLLSVSHVKVERLMERRIREENPNVYSREFLCWIHREFYERLPKALRISYTKSGKPYEIVPGEIRNFNVDVGRHVPLDFNDLPKFLTMFEQRYSSQKILPTNRLIAAAAAHHRLLWIHPFGDGNGRVARLFSHAVMLQEKVGGYGLWTLSRGLARNKKDYFACLNNADFPRVNDLDGRGNLSEKYLAEFCEFFLKTVLDQIQFMEKALSLNELEKGILFYISRIERVFKKDESSGFQLLAAVLREGEIQRGSVPTITCKKETAARKILQLALDAHLLESDTPKGPVRLAFPAKVLESYFPKLAQELE
ncbi:Fic family protein [Pedosphaera parvula]|uniref:Filamentation induced by cAMP protein Fic n=1 Tax=Pedosphaera parvula (strain Ellin514) TaxID=320771 RepID=B9XQR1_PEDPL|nr:Fic family protein [Pedosphaera parvula]EEF57843.1 filamentation induced by cAMP protein Fic [Pedosphaera parvula Ellin514]